MEGLPRPQTAGTYARRRLLYDLADLKRNPLVRASAAPVDDNLLLWHCNLVGPEGTPYAGGIFHIEVTFPETYPCEPPTAMVINDLPHPHVHLGRICLSMLGDFAEYFLHLQRSAPVTGASGGSADTPTSVSLAGSLTGSSISSGVPLNSSSMPGTPSSGGRRTMLQGWSSAYCVRTILLQLQAFLMEIDDIAVYDQESDRMVVEGIPLTEYVCQIPPAVMASRKFHCSSCLHSFAHPYPEIVYDEVAEQPRGEVGEDLVCFHSKSNFHEDVLGLGIEVRYISGSAAGSAASGSGSGRRGSASSGSASGRRPESGKVYADAAATGAGSGSESSATSSNSGVGSALYGVDRRGSERPYDRSVWKRIQSVQSDFDVLSRSAFNFEGVRKSVLGNQFQCWIPLYINSEHANRNVEGLHGPTTPFTLCEHAIAEIYGRPRTSFQPQLAVEFFATAMNNAVVNLMKGEIHNSARFIEGYCVYLRWLYAFSERYKVIKENANNVAKLFATSDQHRSKEHIPDLGKFLAQLTVTDYRWKHVSAAFIREVFARSIMWASRSHSVLADYRPDAAIDPMRAEWLWESCAVSFRLVVFQVAFLRMTSKPEDMDNETFFDKLDARLGKPTRKMVEELHSVANRIKNISGFDEFFSMVELVPPSADVLTTKIREAAAVSLSRGYHSSPAGRGRHLSNSTPDATSRGSHRKVGGAPGGREPHSVRCRSTLKQSSQSLSSDHPGPRASVVADEAHSASSRSYSPSVPTSEAAARGRHRRRKQNPLNDNK